MSSKNAHAKQWVWNNGNDAGPIKAHTLGGTTSSVLPFQTAVFLLFVVFFFSFFFFCFFPAEFPAGLLDVQDTLVLLSRAPLVQTQHSISRFLWARLYYLHEKYSSPLFWRWEFFDDLKKWKFVWNLVDVFFGISGVLSHIVNFLLVGVWPLSKVLAFKYTCVHHTLKEDETLEDNEHW